jgi:uncharacterized Zn finger protein
MEKCPECSFKKVRKVVERDPDTQLIVAVASICKNCGHILRSVVYDTPKP